MTLRSKVPTPVPNTTALEAQRIGLKIIREAVGEDVVLDKDGSPMLNPVGFVDAGRISQDTGHSFDASRDAASGIAARYYMNRNFFVADPDAFTVSTQTVDDHSWHGGKRPLTLDEAKVSIALAAVSGGMFEIGDDLPTLAPSAERLALVKNPDLIDMARLGRSSVPIDLLSYSEKDRQPSVFLLKERPAPIHSHRVQLDRCGAQVRHRSRGSRLEGGPQVSSRRGVWRAELLHSFCADDRSRADAPLSARAEADRRVRARGRPRGRDTVRGERQGRRERAVHCDRSVERSAGANLSLGLR